MFVEYYCIYFTQHVFLLSLYYSLHAAPTRGLVDRLAAGEYVICAEGYLLALARQGYIAHGVWVPEFILEQPEVLRNVHYEFVHAGTDVTEAFQVRAAQRNKLCAVNTQFLVDNVR